MTNLLAISHSRIYSKQPLILTGSRAHLHDCETSKFTKIRDDRNNSESILFNTILRTSVGPPPRLSKLPNFHLCTFCGSVLSQDKWIRYPTSRKCHENYCRANWCSRKWGVHLNKEVKSVNCKGQCPTPQPTASSIYSSNITPLCVWRDKWVVCVNE